MKRALALLAAIALLAVAGCGSDDSNTTSGEKKLPAGGGLPGCEGGKAVVSKLPPGGVTRGTKAASSPSVDLVLLSLRVSDSNVLCTTAATFAQIRPGTTFVLSTLSAGKVQTYNVTVGKRGRSIVTRNNTRVKGAKATSNNRFVTSAIPDTGLAPDSEFGFRIAAVGPRRTADIFPPGNNLIAFPDTKIKPDSEFK